MATAGATTKPSTPPGEVATATAKTSITTTTTATIATTPSLPSNGGVTDGTGSGTRPSEVSESTQVPTTTTAPAEIPPAAESRPPPYPLFIAVLGQTGTGKTTFINDASGTEKVVVVETTIGGRPVRLIDTPGFDDSGRDDAEILETIGQYLREAFTRRIYLTGVIYLHRITDVRMQGSSLRSLLLLKKLCGPKNYGNIALATTRWSEMPDPSEGQRREEQLKSKGEYWRELLEAGASVHRHDRKAASALAIIQTLLPKDPVILQFQAELDACKNIGKTSAGAEVIRSLGEMSRVYEEKIQKLQEELRQVHETRDKWEAQMRAWQEIQIKDLRESQEKVAKDIQLLDQKLDMITNRVQWSRCNTQ